MAGLCSQTCVLIWQDVEKDRQRRSRIAQTFNVEERSLGDRKHWRGFSVRQDPFQWRTAHTKCGLYLLTSSLAAAALDCLFDQPASDSEAVGDRWLSYISTGQQPFVYNLLLNRNRLHEDRYAFGRGKMDFGGE